MINPKTIDQLTLSVLSHDIKSPLATVKFLMSHLRNENDCKKLTAQIPLIIETLSDAEENIENCIMWNDLLTNNIPFTKESFAPMDIIHKVVRNRSEHYNHFSYTIECDHTKERNEKKACETCSRHKLNSHYLPYYVLINNIVKFTSNRGKTRLYITFKVDSKKRIVLSIRNYHPEKATHDMIKATRSKDQTERAQSSGMLAYEVIKKLELLLTQKAKLTCSQKRIEYTLWIDATS